MVTIKNTQKILNILIDIYIWNDDIFSTIAIRYDIHHS